MLLRRVFVDEVGDDRYLVFAPKVASAIVANGALVNALADVQRTPDESQVPRRIRTLLDELGLTDEEPDISNCRGQPAAPTLSVRFDTVPSVAPSAPHQTIPVSFASEVGQSVDLAMSRASQLNAPCLTIRTCSPAFAPAARTLVDYVLDYARGLENIDGPPVRTECVIDQPIEQVALAWHLDRFDHIVVRTNTFFEIGSQDSNENLPDDSWLQLLRALDQSNRSYSIQLDVLPDSVHLLQAAVQVLAGDFTPHEIRVDASFLCELPDQPILDATERFIRAFRKASQICTLFEVGIGFVGAQLGRPADFLGCGPDDATHVSLADGVSTVSSSHQLQQTRVATDDDRSSVPRQHYCSGCYAQVDCLGPDANRARDDEDHFAGTQRCHVIRRLLRDQILTRISESGGLAWSSTRQLTQSNLPGISGAAHHHESS